MGTCDLAWCAQVLGAAPWVLDLCVGVVVIWTIGIVDVQMRRLGGWRWLIARVGYASAWVHERTCCDETCFLCSEWAVSEMVETRVTSERASWHLLLLPEASAVDGVSLDENTHECSHDRDGVCFYAWVIRDSEGWAELAYCRWNRVRLCRTHPKRLHQQCQGAGSQKIGELLAYHDGVNGSAAV